MQQIIKTFHPLRGIMATTLLTALLWGCNNPEKKADEPALAPSPVKMDSPATVKPDSTAVLKMKAKDTLPPLDPTATPRPDDIKTTTVKHKN